MSGRIIVLVISAVIGSVSAGLVAAAPRVSTVQAGADLTAPLDRN